MYLLGIE